MRETRALLAILAILTSIGFGLRAAGAAECEIGPEPVGVVPGNPVSCELECDSNTSTVTQVGLATGVCLGSPDGGCDLQCGPYLGAGISCVAHAGQLTGAKVCRVVPFSGLAGFVATATCRC